MNLKRWLHNLRHLNLMEHTFSSKLAEIDRDRQKLSDRLEILQACETKLEHDINVRLTRIEDCHKKNVASFQQANTNLENEILSLKQTLNKLQSELKKNIILPINVVFLCEQQALYKSFATLVENFSQDKRFKVFVINLWCKDYEKDGSYKYVNPHIEGSCKAQNVQILESYDVARDQWLDLEKLNPDYVFFNRPYDYYRNEKYHIENIAKYAKACYIPYGMCIIGGEVEKFTKPEDFCSQLYFLFLSTSFESIGIKKNLSHLKNLDDRHLLYMGYPRLDVLRNKLENNQFNSDKFNILWLPRWCTSEGNCSFFDYKDALLQYAKEQTGSNLTFRPHPLCFSNFIKTGEMTPDELEAFKANFADKTVAQIDESGDYTEAFLNSSVLVADETSLLGEYFITEKPIIFCEKTPHFSALMEVLVDGMYVVKNKEDLISTLDALRNGQDPLKEKRLELIYQYLLDYGESAAENIKNVLISDVQETL